MKWILGKIGIVLGLLLLVTITFGVGALVDFLILKPLHWNHIPFLRLIITLVLFGIMGTVFEKYVPDDED